MFVCCSKQNRILEQSFQLKKEDFIFLNNNNQLNQGSYGKIMSCRHKPTNKKMIVKILEKHKCAVLEANIYSSLKHKNIGNCIGSFTDKDSIYIISEQYTKGDLYDLVQINGGRIKDEKKVVFYAKQIIEGLDYIRSKGIIHRDIKLSNILIDNTNTIKIIDFGCSKYLKQEEDDDILVGSLGFFSPESLMGIYSENYDMWALGCVIFILLFGFNPFNPHSDTYHKKIVKNILKGFQSEICDGFGAFFPKSIPISQEAMNFLTNLLVLDPKMRMTPEECLQHNWIKNNSG